MEKPVLTKFSEFLSLTVQSYERYLPTSFDESLSLLEKVNKIIVYLDQHSKVSIDLIKQWNDLMEWILANGLDESVNTRLDEMVLDGSLATLINEMVFNQLNDEITQTNSRVDKLENVYVTMEQFPRLGGELNDSPRIQRAIEHAKSVDKHRLILTEKEYILYNPIDLTNLSKGFVIEGQGMSEGGTKVIGKTRGIMFDFAGTPYATMKNMYLFSDTSLDASTIGLFFSRTSLSTYVEFSLIENVKITLGSLPNANGAKGTIGIYNYSAELARYRNIYIQADRCICLFGKNGYNVTSPFSTVVSGFQSMSAVEIDGVSTLTSFAFPALSVDTATDIRLDNTYINCWGSPTDNNKYAIELIGAINTFHLHAHVEDFTSLINGIGLQGSGINLHVSKHIKINGQPQIVLNGSTYNCWLKGGKIELIPMLNTSYEYNLLEQVGSVHGGILNVEFTLYPKQNLYIQYGYVTGTRVYCEDDQNWLVFPSGGYNDGLQVQTRKSLTVYGGLSVPKGFPDFGGRKFLFGGGVPTEGTWTTGDTIWNNFPTAGGYTGWRCISGDGSGIGIWKGFGLIEA